MYYKEFLRRLTSKKVAAQYERERQVRAFFFAVGLDGISELCIGEAHATGLIPYNLIVGFRASLAINNVVEGIKFVRHTFGKDEVYEVFVSDQLVGNMSIEFIGYHSRVTIEAIPEAQ